MSILEFIILGLATWRLTSLLSEEQGPFGVGDWLRKRLGAGGDEQGAYAKNAIAAEVICFWCVSLYSGAFWLSLWLLAGEIAFYAALPFALSAFALALHSQGVRVRKNR